MNGPVPIAVSECWKETGRPGPGTCPLLAEHVLCRNCPTYADAALRLLERPSPAGYVDEWTRHLAAPPAAATHATASVLVFRLGREWLALPTRVIEQVTEPSVVHSLPHRRLPVRGVVTVRGELVVCVSLEALLGLDNHHNEDGGGTADGAHKRLVVLASSEGRLAFVPDDVHGVHRHDPAALMAAPATLARKAGSHFTAGLFEWNSRTVGCLDAERLLTAFARSLS